MRNYKKIAIEDRDIIINLIDQGFSKTAIANQIKCTRKTLLKILQELNISYEYYNVYNQIQNNQKLCSICKQYKSLDDFYYVKNRKKHLSFCKNCAKAKGKQQYEEFRKEWEEYKSNLSCSKCGETKWYLLDFHHKNEEEKDFCVSHDSRISPYSEKMQTELKKCIPLCSNCHREFHYLNRTNGISTDEYLK